MLYIIILYMYLYIYFIYIYIFYTCRISIDFQALNLFPFMFGIDSSFASLLLSILISHLEEEIFLAVKLHIFSIGIGALTAHD